MSKDNAAPSQIDKDLLIRTLDDDLLKVFPEYKRHELRRWRREAIKEFKKERKEGFLMKNPQKEVITAEELFDLGLNKSQLFKVLKGKDYKPKVIKHDLSDNTFTFAVVSDTHLCSKEEKLDELHTAYAICKKDKINTVVHAGDLVAGQSIYKGQENEIHTFGAMNQAQYAIKNYPKIDGIKTYFITGNHDLAFWKQNGIDIGEIIAKERPDMEYVGQYSGDVMLNGVRVRMLHPDGGGAYALSYSAQKIVEQMKSGEKPHILILGHDHTAIYFFHRNVHVIRGGAFEGQTSFLLRKGKQPQIGFWTIKVRVASDKKTILSLTPSFIPFIER